MKLYSFQLILDKGIIDVIIYKHFFIISQKNKIGMTYKMTKELHNIINKR